MKILFTVQAEGRGHMTQAIAVRQMLQRHGHSVAAVIAGGNPSHPLPEFFEKEFGVPIKRIASPGFVQAKNRGISLFASSVETLKNVAEYRRSLTAIKETIAEVRPDLIINFLEPLMGLHNLLTRKPTPTLAVGHQFMINHPYYPKTSQFFFQQMGMKEYVALTGAKSHRLALSFYPAPDWTSKRITVCPPILRSQLFEKIPTNGNRLLVYLVFHGFSKDIIAWSQKNPEVPIDCFYNKPGAPEVEEYGPSLTFHALHGAKFLKMMAAARAVVCTAGFESVSEAAYLGKPLLMVPVENHLEQFLNALDAETAKLGIRDTAFELNRLLAATPPITPSFRSWVDEAERILIKAVNQAAAVEASIEEDAAVSVQLPV